jgi:hypothetical protein
MCTATLDDIREALIKANNRFESKTKGDFKQHFENGKEVVIIFNIVRNRWDYGPPAIYVAHEKVIDELRELWTKELHPNSGTILPPEEKPHLGWQVNFQYMTTNHRLFNFHVTVPAPMNRSLGSDL